MSCVESAVERDGRDEKQKFGAGAARGLVVRVGGARRGGRRQVAHEHLTCSLIAALLLVETIFCLERAAEFSDEGYGPPLQVAARSELVSSNIGRDGADEPRVLGDPDENDIGLGAGPDEQASYNVLARNEIYLLEDKDYPKSLFEDYPRRVGQVSGITTLPSNDVAIFHRSCRLWTADTFNSSTFQIEADKQKDLIMNDTIMLIDRENGGSLTSFGSNLFYMPHSIASDGEGNLWVSDVARHQVMRLPISNMRLANLDANQASDEAIESPGSRRQIWPDIILGEAFVPGDDEAHFCQPAEIAVSSNGLLVFVADGYCNQRVMVFSGAGKYLTSFGQEHNLTVVHSLSLIEERNMLCVADRENARILCYRAGLDGDLERMGELIHYVDYPLGRVFAITSLSEDHLLVSSNQRATNRYDLAILNPFTNELKLVWISTDLLEPHSLASTRDRQTAYAADISKDAYKKVFKFNIIKRHD